MCGITCRITKSLFHEHTLKYVEVVKIVQSRVVCEESKNYTLEISGVAKVGNDWAQAQPIMSSAQPIFMSIVQPIYAPFHVKII